MDYMEGVGEPPPLSPESFEELFRLRTTTFYDFMEIEHDKGIMFAPFDLRTPKGQDVARLLFWRCVEEYSEAISAKTEEHVLEELIDSWNYAAAAIIGCGKTFQPMDYLYQIQPIWSSEDPTKVRLGAITHTLANVTDYFRNRSWMNNSQSAYFDGMSHYLEALFGTLGQIMRCFRDWEQFWKYFMAKDAVLQFRLRSRY